MATSPKQRIVFEIDDALPVDENIIAFALTLKATDEQLEKILTSLLADFSNEILINQDTLLDTLYDATAPALESDAGAGGGND